MDPFWTFLIFLALGSSVLHKFCGAHQQEDDFDHYHDTHSYENSPEYGAYPSREVNNERECDGCGPGGVNFWQFKKSSSEHESSSAGNWGWGWGSEESGIRYGGSSGGNQGSRGPFGKSKSKGKTNVVIQVPTVLVKFLQKFKKSGGGRSRGQPHKQYAPAFISYGPIYGPPPPPPSLEKGKGQKGWTTSQGPSSVPPDMFHRSSTTAATFQYSSVPSQAPTRPPSSYGAPPSWASSAPPPPPQTTPFSHPVPTYGPPVRFHQAPPTRRGNSQQGRYKPPADWDTGSTPTRRTPDIVIQQSHDWSGPEQQPPATYLPPTGSSAPPPGWTSWDSNRVPSQSPSRQNKNAFQQGNRNQGSTPKNFGPPMHNFGPPHGSYGQPPPIIGTEPVNRYAPTEDMYTYPGGSGQDRGQHNRLAGQNQWQQHRSDVGDDVYAAASESDEFRSSGAYRPPTKSTKPPRRRKEEAQTGFGSHYSSGSSHRTNDEVESPSYDHHDPNGRPPPKFDTNYNSPGMSKDPKIVDWMPYSAKNYHDLPGKKKRSKPKYRTLPVSMKNYQPDPEHEKYPKITYDSISKRTLAGPISAVVSGGSSPGPSPRPRQSRKPLNVPSTQRNEQSTRPSPSPSPPQPMRVSRTA